MRRVVAACALLTAGLVAVTVGIAYRGPATAYAASPSPPPESPAPTLSPTPVPTPTPAPTTVPTPTPSPAPTPSPLKVVSVSPDRNATDVSFASAIKVSFSSPLAPTTPYPGLSPKIPGAWKHSGASTLVFVPAGHLRVYATVHLTIPAGSAGVHAADGGRLAKPYAAQFTVKGPTSLLRLQQLLAELGYLPLRFRPAADTGGRTALGSEPKNPDLIALQPASGVFAWRWGGTPPSLSSLWKKGQYTTLTRGAVMAFESVHGLAADGVVGRKVWTAVLADVAAHKAHKAAYNYLVVSTALPQTLSVWQNGSVIYKTAVNTGTPSRPSDKGTFPVYLRFVSTTMSGTNPDGSRYNDPGVPYVAYYNGGEAVHGFRRPGYGYPQSLGCVELSYSAAAVVFRYDPIGTLVTVI